MPQEQAIELNVIWERYWDVIRRRRRWLLLTLFVGWAVVWSATWILPTTYRSETVILIDQQKVPEHYVVPNVAVDLQERLQSMTQQILSRTRLQQIIKEMSLYNQAGQRLSPDELVERLRKDIKIELIQAPGKPADLTAFKIAYYGREPKLTQQVTSHLTSFFIDENLRSREQQSQDTTSFLENQLEDARKHLEGQEARLRQYKAEHLGELPTQLQSNIQILSGLQATLQGTTEALSRAEQQKLYYTSLLDQYRTAAQLRTGDGNSPPSVPVMEQELDHLQTGLADLDAKYTDRHPDVRHLKQQIAKTKNLKQQTEADLSASPPEKKAEGVSTLSSGSNLATTAPIESQLKATNLEIQHRQAEIDELQKRLGEYRSRLNLTPLREQQLADITRDYEQSRANYESLLSKKNQSQLATNLERQQQGEQFRIIDPPSLPTKPYWPNRLQFSWWGLGAGIALAIAVVAVLEVVDDCVRGEEELKRLTPVAILAGIPTLVSAVELGRRRWRGWAEVACGVLMFLVIAAATLESYYHG